MASEQLAQIGEEVRRIADVLEQVATRLSAAEVAIEELRVVGDQNELIRATLEELRDPTAAAGAAAAPAPRAAAGAGAGPSGAGAGPSGAGPSGAAPRPPAEDPRPQAPKGRQVASRTVLMRVLREQMGPADFEAWLREALGGAGSEAALEAAEAALAAGGDAPHGQLWKALKDRAEPAAKSFLEDLGIMMKKHNKGIAYDPRNPRDGPPAE